MKMLTKQRRRCCNGWSRRCCSGWAEGVATNGRVLQRSGGVLQWSGEVLQRMGGRCCNGWSRRCCNGWAECVATNARGQMQQMGEVGGYCNGWLEGVATNRRGGTGKMQQDVVIFHSGWTTVNDATAIYGSYHKCCNKVPCTLHKQQPFILSRDPISQSTKYNNTPLHHRNLP